jgi:hypothetical protein
LREIEDHGCKKKFSGGAKNKNTKIICVNFRSSGCAAALPQLYVAPPLRLAQIEEKQDPRIGLLRLTQDMLRLTQFRNSIISTICIMMYIWYFDLIWSFVTWNEVGHAANES